MKNILKITSLCLILSSTAFAKTHCLIKHCLIEDPAHSPEAYRETLPADCWCAQESKGRVNYYYYVAPDANSYTQEDVQGCKEAYGEPASIWCKTEG